MAIEKREAKEEKGILSARASEGIEWLYEMAMRKNERREGESTPFFLFFF